MYGGVRVAKRAIQLCAYMCLSTCLASVHISLSMPCGRGESAATKFSNSQTNKQTTQRSTIQHSTIQYSITQNNTKQRKTAHNKTNQTNQTYNCNEPHNYAFLFAHNSSLTFPKESLAISCYSTMIICHLWVVSSVISAVSLACLFLGASQLRLHIDSAVVQVQRVQPQRFLGASPDHHGSRANTCTVAHIYVCMYVSMYVCMYVRTYVRMYVCIYMWLRARFGRIGL